MWKRVECLIKERNLKISDVARATEIPYSTFTDWKAGRYQPKMDKIERLASFFHVSPQYLKGWTDNPDPSYNPRELDNEREPIYEEDHVHLTEKDNIELHLMVNGKSYKKDDLDKAMKIYAQFQQASPEVQSAVELLLKAAQSES